MKNKGRRHKAGIGSGWGNCKGNISHITRPIEQMGSRSEEITKFDKKKWSKRVRGYNKSQTKQIGQDYM